MRLFNGSMKKCNSGISITHRSDGSPEASVAIRKYEEDAGVLTKHLLHRKVSSRESTHFLMGITRQ